MQHKKVNLTQVRVCGVCLYIRSWTELFTVMGNQVSIQQNMSHDEPFSFVINYVAKYLLETAHAWSD